jgi:asparagine synthase (glutamine-hydrolysing)
MPGIVGIVTKIAPEDARAQLCLMLNALCRESFYTSGTWADESAGVYAAWIAHQGSFSDRMPLRNQRGDSVLIFAGEEYPEPETLQCLKKGGHSDPGKGPSYLLHLSEDDPSFPKKLNGIFHGLLTDRKSGSALLFNDRYGMYPIYYYQSPEAFYFAAEIKAILAVRPELRRADPKALGEFVALSCVLENRTVFEGIRALPPGSAWTIRGGAIDQKREYFQPSEWESQPSLDGEQYFRELRAAFSSNLPRYLNGGRRVGMTLTGGLDTRVIMAWSKAPPGSLPCYTFGGMFRDCQDVQIARQVAKFARQSHQVITVGKEFLDRFNHYAERTVYLTEGGADVYRSCDLYASEKAREIAPVKVVGTYGSEIVRHAVMFKPTLPAPELFRPEFLPYVHQARDTYAQSRRGHPVTFAAFRQSPWYHHSVLALERSQLTVRCPFLDNEFVRAVYRAPQFNGQQDDIRLRLIREGDPMLARIPSDRGLRADSGGFASRFSRSLLEFTIKAEYAYDYGMPQWMAGIDHALSPLRLERLFLGRHKFSHFRVWYRDALAKYVREILLDRRTLSRPFLEPKGVEAVVSSHLSGRRNYTSAIHKLLTLELLHRLFLD